MLFVGCWLLVVLFVVYRFLFIAIVTCCCCLQQECNDWEIEVTEVYDIFMMSRGVGLLGHWQQRNCYSRVFSLRHSSTIRIQWGGPKYCSRPCTPDAAGLRLKSSHVGPPELLQPFFRGLAGQLSPACCSLASLGWSQQPPQTRLGLASPWSGPVIGQWRRPPQPITGRDDGA